MFIKFDGQLLNVNHIKKVKKYSPGSMNLIVIDMIDGSSEQSSFDKEENRDKVYDLITRQLSQIG